MTRAKYMVEQVTPHKVVISDIGTTHTSVTNDAENCRQGTPPEGDFEGPPAVLLRQHGPTR